MGGRSAVTISPVRPALDLESGAASPAAPAPEKAKTTELREPMTFTQFFGNPK